MYGAYTGVLEHLVLQLQIGKNLKPQAILVLARTETPHGPQSDDPSSSWAGE
jgi:hypothetical protein